MAVTDSSGQLEFPTILALIHSETDFAALQDIVVAKHYGPLRRGKTLVEARHLVNRELIDIIITEVDLADNRGWRDVLDTIESSGALQPLIVVSHLADEFLWAEVLNLGGFDVLSEPFEEEDVVRVLGSALRERRRRTPPRRGAACALSTTAGRGIGRERDGDRSC